MLGLGQAAGAPAPLSPLGEIAEQRRDVSRRRPPLAQLLLVVVAPVFVPGATPAELVLRVLLHGAHESHGGEVVRGHGGLHDPA